MTADRGTNSEITEGATTTARLITSVLFVTGLGWLLDTWLGTWPWLTAFGALGGGALGFYLTWLHVREDGNSGR